MAAPIRPAKQHATFADLESLPDNVVGEIVAGEMFVSPRPAYGHSRASTRLAVLLDGPFGLGRGGPGGWLILIEPELHLHGDALVPDLAGWRRERAPNVAETVAAEIAPDWICEVTSPRTKRLDRIRKLPVYAREGVGHAWLIDPDDRTLEVFRLENGRWSVLLVAGDTDKVHAEPFDAIELELALLWPD